MFDRLTRTEFAGLPIGFAVALASLLAGLWPAWRIALSLDSIRSFSEIAVPSSFAVLFGVIAAVAAVATTHKLDRDDER